MEPHNNIVGKDSGRALEKNIEELCLLHESMTWDCGFGVLSHDMNQTHVITGSSHVKINLDIWIYQIVLQNFLWIF